MLRQPAFTYILLTIASNINIKFNFLPFLTLLSSDVPYFVLHLWYDLRCNKITRLKYKITELVKHVPCVNLRSMRFNWDVVLDNPSTLHAKNRIVRLNINSTRAASVGNMRTYIGAYQSASLLLPALLLFTVKLQLLVHLHKLMHRA